VTFTASPRLALVWGARGFIGSHLVPALLRDGWRVRALTRRLAAAEPEWSADVDWIEYGESRREAFARALDGSAVVFNLAGSSGAVPSNDAPLESLESNCRVQLEFLEACTRLETVPHIVFASSRLVYEPAGTRPVREDQRTAPRSIYAAHKLCVEHYHQVFGARGAVTYTICRISNPYGIDRSAAGKHHGFVNTLIHNALTARRLTIFGDGLQLRDYIHIDDLTTMLRLCVERTAARNEVLNIGLGSSVRIVDAARAIQRTFGGGNIEHLPWPPGYEQVESGDFVVDIGKAQALLGFTPRFTLETGLRRIRAHRATANDGPLTLRAAALG
jgi:UDP-glucose 4-epimerase